jgi:hypothetical protein
MKITQWLVLAIMAGSLSGLSGCASTGEKGTRAGDAKRVAYTKPVSKVNSEPTQSVTPGGVWPPHPEQPATAVAAEAPKMLNTDSVDIAAKRDPKAELKQRVVERWALLIAQRGDQAFDYLSPGYQQTHDRVKYGNEMASRPVRWHRATFDHAECTDATSCEVTALVDFKVKISAGMAVAESFAYVKERWISIDGVWYYLPTDVGG